jgi:hypothetical protein
LVVLVGAVVVLVVLVVLVGAGVDPGHSPVLSPSAHSLGTCSAKPSQFEQSIPSGSLCLRFIQRCVTEFMVSDQAKPVRAKHSLTKPLYQCCDMMYGGSGQSKDACQASYGFTPHPSKQIIPKKCRSRVGYLQTSYTCAPIYRYGVIGHAWPGFTPAMTS